MLVTLAGRLMLVSPVQLLKAEDPMELIPDGKVTLVSPAQSEKASLPIAVTPVGTV